MWLNPFPNKPWVLRVCNTKSLENNVGNGEIARDEQFLHFSQCSILFEKLSAIFVKFEIVVCKLFQYGNG